MMWRKSLLFVLSLTCLFFGVSSDAKAEQGDVGDIKIHKNVVDKLTTLGIKMYELDSEFVSKFPSAIESKRGETLEAGEGLPMELYNDPINIFLAILDLDPNNIKAHLYLGKSYRRKSYEGEGVWNKDLATKARQEFLTARSLSKKVKTDRAFMKDLTSDLEEVEKILEDDQRE